VVINKVTVRKSNMNLTQKYRKSFGHDEIPMFILIDRAESALGRGYEGDIYALFHLRSTTYHCWVTTDL
jgi:hypothetical protein